MSAWVTPNWPAPPNVRALTTLRGGFGASQPPYDRANFGLNCGDDLAAVHANRAALAELARLPEAPRWLRQVHGTSVCAAEAIRGDVTEADASVTVQAGVVLAILTADCLPVLFCSRDGRAIGAARAGWRGLAAGVLEATVAAMSVPAEQLIAWLGPAAGPQAYEVGDEVRAAFVNTDPVAADAFRPTRPGHFLCDLYALARLRLAQLGLGEVYGGGLCTISDRERFFSHRRDGRSGRMATLIWR